MVVPPLPHHIDSSLATPLATHLLQDCISSHPLWSLRQIRQGTWLLIRHTGFGGITITASYLKLSGCPFATRLSHSIACRMTVTTETPSYVARKDPELVFLVPTPCLSFHALIACWSCSITSHIPPICKTMITTLACSFSPLLLLLQALFRWDNATLLLGVWVILLWMSLVFDRVGALGCMCFR